MNYGEADSSSRANRPVKVRHIALTVLVVVAALWVARPFLTPLAWGALVAIAEWPLFRRAVARFGDRQILLAAGFALLTGVAVAVPLSITAVSVVAQSDAALEWLKHAQQNGIPAPSFLAGVPLFGTALTGWWHQHLASPQGADALSSSINAASLLHWAKVAGGTIAWNVGSFVFALLFLGSLLARGREIARSVWRIAGRLDGAFGRTFARRMVEAVRSTINGTLLVSVGEGVLIGVGYVVAGVPTPLLFAFATIVLALIPLGAWAVFGVASLILVGEGRMLAAAVLFAISGTVMQIGDNVVQGIVVGKADRLPFELAILGSIGGLTAFGLIGLFIGPVVMTALLLILQEWMQVVDTQQATPTQG